MLAAPAAAQYGDVLLPQGVLQVTVEDLPINATTAPVSPATNPRIAGSLTSGEITIELAVADAAGAIIRFPSEVNRRGGFRQRVPEALQPGGEYTLYINDVMIGQFTIAADAVGGTGGEGGGDVLELARLVPFPGDAAGAIAGLGLVPELSSYQSIPDLARVVAENANNNNREGREQAEAELAASGFVQRYQSSLAVPAADDPSVFEIQIAAIVTEYDTAETAAASFAASATGGEAVESPLVGDESRVSRQSAEATQTGAVYQSLQLIFRQDRLLIVINYADLLNREPDQALLEAMGQAVQQRGVAVLAGEAPALTRSSLQLNLDGIPRSSAEQLYGAIDGAMVPLFGESEESINTRATAYTGATDVSVSTSISRGTGENEDATAEAETAAPFSYVTTILRFPSPEDASAWLGDLNEQSPADLRPEFLSLSTVTDAPAFGEGSVTYSFTRQLEGQTAAGYLTYVQVGADVAAVELAAVPEAPFAAFEPLVTGQAECLTAGACPVLADPPAELAAAGGEGGDDGQDGGDGQGQGGGDGQTDDAEQTEPDDESDQQGDLPSGIERESEAPEDNTP